MNLNLGLALLTYNENAIRTPREDQSNIYLGIGLWSRKDGLSAGLPIDVMQMLLTAKLMHAKLNPTSRVIILIADSLAINEGAPPGKTAQIASIYKSSLLPLLDLLKLKECTEIILSSELDTTEALAAVEKSPAAQRLKAEDKEHANYILSQTAISRTLNRNRGVGIKIGWIQKGSWDEQRFDRWNNEICPDTTIQCLYTKAGIKQARHPRSISVSEGCPYIAHPKDQRYIIRTQTRQELKATSPLTPRASKQWKGVAQLCSDLIQAGIVSAALLPPGCIRKTNDRRTTYNMLNHWVNGACPQWQAIDPYEIERLQSKASGKQKTLTGGCMLLDELPAPASTSSTIDPYEVERQKSKASGVQRLPSGGCMEQLPTNAPVLSAIDPYEVERTRTGGLNWFKADMNMHCMY